MTRETETLFYNIRMIIDSKVETEPRAWLISKVNRISPNGIARITLTQDLFDQHRDYIERDESGHIIGMWANYYESNVEPIPISSDDVPISSITSAVTCSGKPQIKIGGSAKTFTVTYYDENGDIIDEQPVMDWSFYIDDVAVPNSLLTLTPDGNKIKIKFLGDDSYIGKVFTITNTSGDVVSSLNVEILPL